MTETQSAPMGADGAGPADRGTRTTVRVLGGTAGTVGDRAVDLGGPRQRAVLGLLVVSGGVIVPASTLVAEVWGATAPANPAGALQSYVSHLRRALQPGAAARERGAVIASEGRGYALRLPRDAVDAWHFEDLVEAGVALDDAPGAIAPLREALALWRGVPYADHAGARWAEAEQTRLDGLRRLAEEHLLAARLAAGEHAVLVPELRTLVADDPLREDRWRLLALALYRAGRQAQALEALREARDRLVDELGVEPGPALRELEAGILAHDPRLTPEAPRVSPVEVTPAGPAAETHTAPSAPSAPPSSVPEPEGPSEASARPRSGQESALVDRERELAVLARAVEAAADGFGGTVLVSGAAGIGKTRLLEEVLGTPAAGRALVLSGRGSRLEREFGFGVVRQLFEPLLAEPAERDRLLAGAARAAAPVFEPGESAATGDATFSILHGLYWLVLRLAEERPVVLAVDDLQWCDSGTIRFLAFLAHRIGDQPLLLLATRRTGEQDAEDAALTEIELDPDTTVVTPAPLSTQGTAGVVGELLGEADAAFTAACHRTTGGNPLLLRQLLRALQAENVPPDAGHADTVNALGSRAVGSVVVRRLAALGPSVVAVAQAVAVLGDGCGLPLVAAFAELPEADAADAAAAAAAAEILRDEHPLGFVHPLVRDAVYQGLSAARRGLAHDRAARLLEADGASAESIAAHLLLAPPRGARAVVEQLRRAAGVARDRGTLDSAITYLTRALAEPAPPDLRGLLLAELGTVETSMNGKDALGHLLEARAALPPGQLSAEVAAMAAQTLVFTGAPGEATAYAFAAKRELHDVDDDVLQRLEAVGRSGGYMHGLEVATWQSRPAEPSGTGVGARMLAASLSFEQMIAGVQRERSVELARFATEGTLLTDHDPGLFWVIAAIMRDCADDDLGTYWEDQRTRAYLGGSLFSALSVHLWHGNLLLRRGDLRQAVHELRISIEQSMEWENGQIGAAYGQSFLTSALLDRGDVAGAAAVIGRCDPVAYFGDSRRLIIEAVAEVALAQGRPQEALELFEDATAQVAEVVNPAWIAWRSQRARALVALGRAEEAVSLVAEELAVAEQWGAPRVVGRTLRLLGELQGDAGRDVLARAVDVLAPTAAPLELARALSALAPFETGPRRVEALTRAYELAQRSDAEGLRRDLAARLEQEGAPVPPGLTGLARLATIERRAVELLAEDLDVNEVAQRLFITPRGVRDVLAEARAALGAADDAALVRSLER